MDRHAPPILGRARRRRSSFGGFGRTRGPVPRLSSPPPLELDARARLRQRWPFWRFPGGRSRPISARGSGNVHPLAHPCQEAGRDAVPRGDLRQRLCPNLFEQLLPSDAHGANPMDIRHRRAMTQDPAHRARCTAPTNKRPPRPPRRRTSRPRKRSTTWYLPRIHRPSPREIASRSADSIRTRLYDSCLFKT